MGRFERGAGNRWAYWRTHVGAYAAGVGYRRVSTSEQRISGLGLEAHQVAIEAAALRLGVTLTATFTDAGISGRAPLEQRPGLADALTAVRRGGVLLCAKRDRVSRDVLTAIVIERELAKKNARLISASGEGTESDDPTAIFTRRILDAVAELERALIAGRTRAALQRKRARGELAGEVPLGCKVAADGRTLEPCVEELAVLNRLYTLRVECRTHREIVGAERGWPRHATRRALASPVRGSANQTLRGSHGDDKATARSTRRGLHNCRAHRGRAALGCECGTEAMTMIDDAGIAAERAEIERVQRLRWQFLLELYRYTKQVPAGLIPMVAADEIARRIGNDNEPDVEQAYMYLESAGLLTFMAMGPQMAITRAGIDEVERAFARPDQETRHLPPLNIIHNVIHGGVHGSTVQQGTTQSCQVIEHANRIDWEGLRAILADARTAAATLPTDQREELLADIETLETQARSPKPKAAIVRASVESVKAILANVAGNIAAAPLIQWTQVHHWLWQ